MTNTLAGTLRALQCGEVREHEPMAAHTTWKIGGPADLLLIPRDLDGLRAMLACLHEHRVPWMVIGRGSNTLVSDGGIRGAVIKLEQAFADVQFDGGQIDAGAAFSFIKLSVLAGKHGLTGLEFAGGIPGSVGGAVYMNAGAHGTDIAQILTSADVLFADGTIRRMTNAELTFAYRHSILQTQAGIVLRAQFALQTGERREIAAKMASFKERRQRTQPWNQPCAGSVFRNPPGDFAARLIEQAGLKGKQCGDAQISPLHANFIVNLGQAKAADVLHLIAWIRTEVRHAFGVDLVAEVLVLGEQG
jgi:UDP-N-acetylmuramate dehydrogenase